MALANSAVFTECNDESEALHAAVAIFSCSTVGEARAAAATTLGTPAATAWGLLLLLCPLSPQVLIKLLALHQHCQVYHMWQEQCACSPPLR